MMQKRTLYSLLLTSFILVFAFASASAQQVTVDNNTVARCVPDQKVDITVTNSGTISAFEIILEVTSASGGAYFTAVDVQWDPALVELTNRVVDITAHNDGTPDTIRIAGMLIDAGDACLDASAGAVVGQVVFTTNDVCDGTIELDGIDFVGTACGCPLTATTQFVDCGTTTLGSAAVVKGTVTVQNIPPTIDPIGNGTVHWGLAYNGLATGGDLDEAACETLTFSKGTPSPAAMNVAGDGSIYWLTTGADVGNNDVTIVLKDKCGDSVITNFTICVENTPPEITCPPDTVRIIWGETAGGSVSGIDPDGGPSALMYTVASFSGPGAPAIDPNTGAWQWPTIEDNAYLGLFELCLAVNDGGNIDPPCAPTNADTCCVYVLVIPTIRVTIEKTHKTPQGGFEEVSIYLDDDIDPANEMGGFDFLIYYDQSALTFQAAVPGQLLIDCGWEYFTYRYGPNGNCGPGACPSGHVRMVALAETNNGPNHPLCFSGTPGQLVSMSFLVTNDRTYECMYAPIRWKWYDCGDNTISSKSGDTLFLSRHVYDYYFDGEVAGWIPVEDLGAEFPSFFGANASCDTEDKAFPLRLIDFYNGGIDIVCADSIDDRGDINLNGLANEIADAVLYTRYFVYGLSVFSHVDAQTAASDVNADGMALTVGDLVYLVRIIVGDAQPYPKNVSPTAAEMIVNHGRLSIDSDVPMGAALVVAEGNVSPVLLAGDMDMLYAYDAANNQTRMLVYSTDGNSFTGEFLEVSSEVVAVEIATYEGHPVKIEMIPANFALAQNYPNPFNPKTTIAFDVPVATDYTLTIFNINGQEVTRFDGTAEAGTFEIDWDASTVGSGVYFYRLEAGAFSDTKKMVLVK